MRDVDYIKQNGFDVDDVFESFGTMELYDEILRDFYDAGQEKCHVNENILYCYI